MARNPVTFSNGTLVQKAQVEVDGTTYDVEPAQYDGTTPLSANNLNLLQTRLYDYVDDNINNLTNNVYYKDNYAILTGTITMPGSNESSVTGSDTINYPTNFTKNNCVVISLMAQRESSSLGYATTQQANTSSSVRGNGDLVVVLGNSDITVSLNKSNAALSSYVVDYKIVLLKYTN